MKGTYEAVAGALEIWKLSVAVSGVWEVLYCIPSFWLNCEFWFVSACLRVFCMRLWQWKFKASLTYSLFSKIVLILDLESIGSSPGINWELFGSGVEWSGPAIRPGLDNRHLIIEGHRGPLDFGTWIWDLDLGPGFGTWIWDCRSWQYTFNHRRS